MPFKMAWTLPKLDGIVLMTFEEIMKVREDDCWLNLVGIDRWFENFSSYMDGIGDNNNLGHIIEIHCLVNAASNYKEFYFSTCNMNHVVNCLCQRFVVYVHMRDRCGNIVLDACIRYYDGGGRGWRGLQNYIVKLISVRFIIWEIVNYSKSRRKF